MANLQKVLVVILTPLLLNLYTYASAGGASPQPVKPDKTEHEPQSRVILQKDIAEVEESWFSKYKWWIVGGAVLIAGAATAGGGGGGGDSGGTPAEEPAPTGPVTVTW